MLHALAARAGVDVRYHGWRGELVEARPEALLAILAALGHDVREPDDATAALAAMRRAWWQAGAPPVIVSWDDGAGDLALRVRADHDADWEVEVVFEDRAVARHHGRLFALGASDHAQRDGRPWCLRHVVLPAAAHGYHDVMWRVGEATGRARWIAAPTRAFASPGEAPRSWGVFAPLYALRSHRSGGAGDLGELARLAAAVGERGGRFVATLPLLAAFLGERAEPSPYSPASRLAWNELYLDLWRAPGLDLAPEARESLASPGLAAERVRLAGESLIDYRAQYRWRRGVIDQLAEAAWQGGLAGDLEAFARTGEVADYAAFRALGEQVSGDRVLGEPARTASACGQSIVASPASPAGPPLAIDDLIAGRAPVNAASWRTHVYAQWAMDQQLAGFDGGDVALYLDLPVGVNRDAFEVWRHRDAFVLGAGVGAPPDALFLGGQGWGLPPLHPDRMRARGWDHLIACVRHHMRHAGMLRIDHVMGLHRLFWVPEGFPNRDGVYVRYAADEVYAILCLESHRNACVVVGEDLGVVPDFVPPAMRRHGLAGLHVAQFALPGRLGEPLGAATATQVACINTHDTPTFAGWWRGADIADKLALGLITAEQAEREHVERALARPAVTAAAGPAAAAAAAAFEVAATAAAAVATGAAAAAIADAAAEEAAAAIPAAVLLGITRALAAGESPMVLVTLEDAWLEPSPQNVPGTSHERPNWRRPFALDTDAALADPRVTALLDAAKRT